MSMEVHDRPDVEMKIENNDVQVFKKNPIIIKEGVEFRMKIKFKIQNEVVAGLKFLQVVRRMGLKVDKTEEMIGSYGPSADPFEKKFQMEQAPSGMMARGVYEVKSKFIDDDGITHLEFSWCFEIKKDWV
jgi:hypothetical protein